MKAKGFKLSSILVVISAMLLALIGFVTDKTIVEATSSDAVTSYYMLLADGATKTNIEAGKTTGYDQFLLGHTNVELETTANAGFDVVQWLIKVDGGTKTLDAETSTYTHYEPRAVQEVNFVSLVEEGLYVDNGGEYTQVSATDTYSASTTYYIAVTITAGFTDLDSDGLNDTSKLTVSEVFDDLEIEPVFDYTYYNLVLDSISNDIEFYNFVDTNISEYDVSSGLEGTAVQNVVIPVNGHYAYFEEAYQVNYEASLNRDPSYYVLQNGKKADVKKGAYILNQTVGFGFDIQEEIKIEATGMNLLANTTKTALAVNQDASNINELEDNSVKFSLDAFGVTQDFYGKVKIQEDRNLVNDLEIIYNQIYEVQINITLDGTSASDEVIDVLLNGTANSSPVIAFENYFAKVDDFYILTYYVRKASDNPYNKKFTITAYDYYETVNGNQYFYYDFVDIDGKTANKADYSTFSDGVKVININYVSAKYTVAFEFGILHNGEITKTDKEITDTVELVRGDSQQMPIDDAIVGVTGYNFLGYYDPILKVVSDGYFVEIHETEPINVTVLRIYEKVNYTIQLQNHNTASINDGTNVVYPLSSVSYVKNGEAPVKNTELTTDQVNLISTLNIDDTIVLSQTVNDGFVFNGYYMVKAQDNSLTQQITANTFELTEDNINTYDADKDGIIVIYAGVDYTTYTITYTIEQSADATQGVMATISATYPARLDENTDIVKTYIDNDDTKAVTSITIRNIRKYDEVNIISVGNTETPEGEETYQYVFIMFTENNGQSSLSKTNNGDVYTHTEKVTRDKSIKVIYSTPKAMLSVQFYEENVEGYKTDSLVVTVNGTEASTNELGLYEIERTGSVAVTLQVNEGYVFSKYVHEGNGETLEGSTLPYEFTVNTDNAQTLTIYFEAIEYVFNVTQNGGGKVNEVVSKTLSVNNATLSFDKPTGYRVAVFKMYMNNTSNYEDYSLTNSSVIEENGIITTQYSVTFTADEFLNIIKASAVTKELAVQEVNIQVEYEIYTLTVRVNNKLINPRGDGYDTQIEFPQITATTDYSEPYTITYIYNKNEQSVLVQGIPYGSNVTITPANTIPLGLKFAGWKNNAGTTLPTGYVTNGILLYIENVTEAKVVRYYLEYIEFNINLTYESVQGSPVVYADNAVADKIKTYQTLRIETRPNSNGFKFEELVYYSMTKYAHDVESWNELNEILYVNKNGSLVLNESNIHDPSQTYYIKNEIKYTGNTTFTLNGQFHLSKYYATEEEGFVVKIRYATREITIVNNSKNFDANTDLIVAGDLNISTDKYAIYTIKAINAEGQERDVLAGNTVNIYDTVQISIQINQNAQNGIQNQYFDLSKGLLLVQDFSAYLPVSNITNNGGGNYLLEFNMSDVMATIPESEILEITYQYIISNRTVTYSTNVNHSTFNSNIELAVTDAEGDSASANGSVSHIGHYLTKGVAGYKFSATSGYDQFIKIYDVKIYEKVDVGGVLVSKLVDPANYENYGIKIQKDQTGKVISSVEVRYLYNLDVVFIASPVVLLDGKEISAGETYTFEKVFNCDETGNGLAQNLTIGTKTSNNISSVEIVTNAIKVTYKDSNGRIVEWGIDPQTQKPYGPTNAGVYSVEISFISNNSDYSWLEDISLPYTVSYIITPKQISLTYNVILAQQQTKTYDGSSSQIVSKWIGSVVFTDNQNFNYAYINAIESELNGKSSFTFNTNAYRAYTSYTDNGVEVETATANDAVFYNVTIEGLQLNNTTFNNNFTLTNNTVVILNCMKIARKTITITGLEAYDKVYDGTNIALLNKETNIIINGVLANDEVSLNKDSLVATFNSAEKSIKAKDKVVTVKAEVALEGAHVANYKVQDVVIQEKTIYPDFLTVELDSGKEIKLYNQIGLTDPAMASLIPIGAELEANVIYSDSNEYAKMYGKISQFLSRTNVFAVGYKLTLTVDDGVVPISKNLHLSVPPVENMTGVLYVGGEQAGSMQYTTDETGNIVVDLGTIEANVTDIVLTQRRALLQLWQIILIVVLSVVAVGTGVTVFIVIRKKKTKQYSANEKI